MKKRREPKRYAPGEQGMAEILHEVRLREYAPLTADDIRGLTPAEIRQLWLKRREEMRQQERPARRWSKATTRQPHPDRVAILKNYRQRKARRERNAAKNTAQWVADEVKAGRMTEDVHPDTIRAWDRKKKKRM